MQINARHGHRAFTLEQQRGGDLSQRLEHQHTRHERNTGKMALKEILVDGDVLMRDETSAGLVLRDDVDEQRRVAITQPVE
jgi:hypothetical protein